MWKTIFLPAGQQCIAIGVVGAELYYFMLQSNAGHSGTFSGIIKQTCRCFETFDFLVHLHINSLQYCYKDSDLTKD